MEDYLENENIIIFEHGTIDTKRMIGDELEELETFRPTFINTFTREIKNQCFNLFHASSNNDQTKSADLKSEAY